MFFIIDIQRKINFVFINWLLFPQQENMKKRRMYYI